MERRYIELTIGSLLHDIGKILYRYNDGRNHSISGYEFLKELGIKNDNILNQVRYHHKKNLASANLINDDLSYITYWADNVAAAADRKTNENSDEIGYDKYVPLASIFNILNGNEQDYSYPLDLIYDNGQANMPSSEVDNYSKEIYNKLLQNIKDNILGIELKNSYLNSLLSILEANLSFVPSSTDKSQLCDISLYDHSKITAAIAGCVYRFFIANNIKDYCKELYIDENKAYQSEMFQLVSMDISGIQEFIFTTANKDALKTLRAKSFYLEIMLEHIIDELLARIGLSRANLIYSGGGHAYLIVDNSQITKNIIEQFNIELKKWFLDNFKTELFIAIATESCSANDLMNRPNGAYKMLFSNVSRKISEIKSMRYNVQEILSLNESENEQYVRECKVCGTLNELNSEDVCLMCDSLIKLSKDILSKTFVNVLTQKINGRCVKLPFDRYMIMEDEDETRNRIKCDEVFLRSYSKNKLFTGQNMSTKIWTGDYHLGESFSDLAKASKGINRIGVLRADVDNLGQAFVSGFEKTNGSQQYVSISRSATFSRKMSIFFKLHLNDILRNGKYSLNGNILNKERNVIIIYSGGDDLFLVGAWNEILEVAIDINNSLKTFSQGTLSISAGIGVFVEKFPIRAFARTVGELEDIAKNMDGKNSIALFDETQTYKWEELIENVLGEKYDLIKRYFDSNVDKGMAVLYKLLQYIRKKDEKINVARFAYLLGRMEPDLKAPDELKQLFYEFSKKIYKWINNEKDSKELITAIYIYVYLNRDKEVVEWKN